MQFPRRLSDWDERFARVMGCSVYQYHVFYNIFAPLLKKQGWYILVFAVFSVSNAHSEPNILCTLALVLGPPEENSILSNMHANHILNRGVFSQNLTASSFQSWQAKKTTSLLRRSTFSERKPKKKTFIVNFLWPLCRTDAKFLAQVGLCLQSQA